MNLKVVLIAAALAIVTSSTAFTQGTIGGGAQTSSSTPSGQAQTTSNSWVATAGGFAKGAVRVGFARRSTRSEAEAAALSACHSNRVRCSRPYAVSSGCLYIVAGKKPGRTTWGRGSTQETALIQCRDKGYSCNSKDVIGGCAE